MKRIKNTETAHKICNKAHGWLYGYVLNLHLRRNRFNPSPAKLTNLNFHPLEVVSRYHDPQLQVGENSSYFFLI